MPTSDEAETEPVVTMVVYDEDQKRLFTVHIHRDGSYKIGGKEGRKRASGQNKNIVQYSNQVIFNCPAPKFLR